VICRRWDVIAVNFPFIEGTDAKRRPALVISSDKLYSDHGIFWIAMITTAKTGLRPNDIPVTNLERAGLPEDCVIRVPRITAVGGAQIARKLGDITPKDRTAVSALLRQYVP
jgi:mRNA-degrading endonuclease toxin of MazEF toxin-antitoxin module